MSRIVWLLLLSTVIIFIVHSGKTVNPGTGAGTSQTLDSLGIAG